ncbi:MAG: hypothetical protein JJU13_21065 [Balneolaceae bacterium]|nr:hypothetical protein [Balneolaceae bacterium]
MTVNVTEKKLEFFDKLLSKNPDLQKQFEQFMSESDDSEGNPCRFDSGEYISEAALSYIEDLENLDFSKPDWEMYTPRHSGYIPDYEAMEHMAEDMIAEEFEIFNLSIIGEISRAKSDLALLSLPAIYDACIKAEIPDEYDTLYDHHEYLLEGLRVLQTDVIKEIEKMVLPGRQVRCFFYGFFEHFQSGYNDNDEFLRFFEPLMLSLITEQETAEYVEKLINELNIPRHFMPQTATELFRVCGNTAKWTEQAEELCDKDVAVARNLLVYYAGHEYDEYIRISKKLWNAGLFQRELGEFIFQNIRHENHPEFYKNVLLWLTSTFRRISYYNLLRDLMQPDEKNDFILHHKGDHLFYTGMLEAEGRYSDILQFIRQHFDSYKFNQIISKLLEPYPEESFALLKRKVLNTVETERGRNVYQIMVEWLRIAKKIKGMNGPVRDLVSQLYDWQPRLPALRDELKKAGFIKQ